MLIIPVSEMEKPQFGVVEGLAQGSGREGRKNDDCPTPKVKFFTTMHAASFIQVLPRKFFPCSSVINCKFIQSFL